MAAEQMLGYHYREGEVKFVLDESTNWAILYGTSLLLTGLGGDDVRQFTFGPDRLRAEPGIADSDKSRFLGVTRLTTKAELTAQFPDKADAIAQARAPRQLSSWWGEFQQMPEDRVEVLEAYCRSGHWFLLVGDGGTVLASGLTPKRCMPLQLIRYTVLPDEIFGMGMVEQALPAQYAFTSAWNLIMANMRLMSQPKILIPQNSGIAPDAFTSQAGEKIYFRNAPPTPWNGQPLPQFAQQLPAAAQSALADMTSIHASAQGKRTPGITTGVAMQTLIGSDEMQFGMTKVQIKRAVERAGKCALLYMQAYYSQDKIMREFDRYGAAIAVELRATDIADNPQVFIEADTLFASDAQARQERVMEFARMGAIPPAQAIDMLQRNIDPMRPQKPIADYLDAKRALEAVVRQGFQAPDPSKPPPAPGVPAMRKTVRFYPPDNFEIYADTVKQFMRSQEFEALPLARQDDVEAYYRDILGQMQQAAQPQAAGPMKPLAQKPGLPAGVTPGNTPDNAGGGAIERTPDREVELAQGLADTAGAS